MSDNADVDYNHGHDFSEDDEGKSVVTTEGRQVGTRESVLDGDPKFRHDPEMPGPLKESLGVSDGPTSTLQHDTSPPSPTTRCSCATTCSVTAVGDAISSFGTRLETTATRRGRT